MTVNQIIELSKLIKNYTKGSSIPVELEEMNEWCELLDKDFDIYVSAIKTMFRNIDLEKNQKLVRQFEKYPLATLNQIGNEMWEERERQNHVNKLALGQQVILLTEGYRYNTMSARKTNEKGQVIWEDIKDENGKLIYLEVPEEVKLKGRKEGYFYYWDKKELLEKSRRVSREEVMKENPYNPYNRNKEEEDRKWLQGLKENAGMR